MSTHKLHVALATALSLSAGCSERPSSKPFANGTDVHDDIVRQTDVMTLKCPKSAMLFFIGSSESTSTIETWNIDVPGKADIERSTRESEEKFSAAIATAKEGLVNSLKVDPRCDNDFEIGLIAVIDGPQVNDSSIESFHYAKVSKEAGATKVWKQSVVKSWSFDGQILRQLAIPSSFELDMSRDVGKIVDFFAKNTLKTIDESKAITSTGAMTYGQVSYVIKTHGARIANNSQYVPSLSNLKEYPRSQLKTSDWEPALFIDTQGRNGPIKSDAYSAHWRPKDIQSVLAQVTDPGATSGDPGATSGDPGATSGDGDWNRETSGDKSLAFKESVVPSSANYDFLGKKNLGSYATYQTGASASASYITFPVAQRSLLDSDYPKNLIILDSCYGSEKILTALRYGSSSAANTVVLASTGALYYQFLDYSKLNISGLLKFPALLERLKKGINLTQQEKQLFDNMENGTLVWESEDKSKNFKKLAIWAD